MANILMVVPALYCGGGLQKISLLISQELIKRKHNLVVIDEYPAPLEQLGYLSYKPIFERLGSYIPSDGNIRTFNAVLKKHNIQVVIYQGFFKNVNEFLNEWHKGNKSIPVLSVYHNSPDQAMPEGRDSIIDNGVNGFFKRLFYPLYYIYCRHNVGKFLAKPIQFSSDIILLSNAYIEMYRQFTGYKKEVKVISNFILGEEEIALPKKKKQILYVGRMTETQKCVSRAIKIWEKISQEVIDWNFVLAGTGNSLPMYKQYVVDHKIPRIEFLGHVNDPTYLYKESAISLLVSSKEGFGLVIPEAMSKGCVPIIYNTFLVAAEIIDNELNGILIEPYDEDKFIHKVLDLINDESKREMMAKQAMLKAKKFLPANIMSQWENLLISTTNKKDQNGRD